MLSTIYCILPVYKGDDHDALLTCLNSINSLIMPADTLFHLCIAIDGTVPEKHRLTIERHKQKCPYICSIFFSENNRGIAANLNNVISKLMEKKNVYFMRMDADDINEPDRLVTQLLF